MYANVLIEYSNKKLDQNFTYKIPSFLKDKIKKGMKVLVPFGRMTLNGFVTDIINSCDKENLKEIISLTDEEFILNDELLELGKKIKEITFCSLISAYQAMLPSSMKVKNIESNYQKYNEYIVLNSNPDNYIKEHKNAKKQIELLNRLINNERIFKNEYPPNIIKTLIDNELITIQKEKIYRLNKSSNEQSPKTLTEEQQNAFDTIKKGFNTSEVYLLHGITGSGKTEVYIKLIDEVLKEGKTAIMLVPEISLTTQIIERFYNHYGNIAAIFHSSLSEGEKYDEYHKILNGDAKVIVGTRSAIFMPINNIGIIIMDEEHSTNYKQDVNPRYHARDIAILRCKYHNAPLVLGSATPSFESYARAKKDVYHLVTLNKRIGLSVIPNIKIIDMQEEYKKGNMVLSDNLKEELIKRLDNHEQSIIFLNRRGFNTYITCKNCGYTFKCPHCDITLTYHKSSNHLRCHYCGYTLLNFDTCPECHERAIDSYGLGTEKLESDIKDLFPSARVIRMDADTTTRKNSQKEIIKNIEEEKIDIIIGTQMISKGFDFPKVTLVGVINADESLNIPDFRASEYTYDLLSQVCGRAGRSSLKGTCVIQTFNPGNQTLNYVKNNNYQGLFNYEMNIRKILKYPPYFYITIIKIASKDYEEASNESIKVRNYLNRYLKDVYILGPTTSKLFKINNVYRFQIIIKYKNINDIKEILLKLKEIYKSNNKVNIEIDNNPCYI